MSLQPLEEEPMMRTAERRWRHLWISVDIFLGRWLGRVPLVKNGMIEAVRAEGVPDDAEVIAVRYDQDTDRFQVRLYHPSWAIVPEGCAIPDAQVTFTLDTYRIADETRGYRYL